MMLVAIGFTFLTNVDKGILAVSKAEEEAAIAREESDLDHKD
jgi:hypothetical protein